MGTTGRTTAVTFAAAAMIVSVGAGCSDNPPVSHYARVWLQKEDALAVRLEGERPTIKLENAGPGNVLGVELESDGDVTRVGSIGVDSDTVLTVDHGGTVRLVNVTGAEVRITVWNATGVKYLNFTPAGAQASTMAP